MRKIAYFDNAATTFPKPECVYKDIDKYNRELGVSIGRGQYSLSSDAYKLSQDTRNLIKELFHSNNKDVVFTHTATEALNLVIRSIVSNNSNVYISPFEHNAVTRTLHYLSKSLLFNVIELKVNKDTLEYDLDGINKQFKDIKPNVLIVSHASNVCGVLAPIKDLFTLSKNYDCINVVDMCQSAGLIDTDLSSNIYDYTIFDGHKTLYGPFGIGGILSSELDKLNPIIFGGTGIDSANQEMINIPDKFEVGSHNLIAIGGLYSALNWIKDITISEIYNVEHNNYKRLLEILSKMTNVKTFIPKSIENSVGVASCVFDGYSSDDIGNVLNRLNVAVRTGLHCSPLAHKFLGTFPQGTVRFSVSYFNSEDDFNILTEALNYIKENS